MVVEIALEKDPGVREYRAAVLCDVSRRSIQRWQHTGGFPKPDYYEQWGTRRIPFWRMSTLRAWKESRRVAA